MRALSAELVVAARRDPAALAVLADHLLEEGDRRGELIAHALRGEPAIDLARELDPAPGCEGLTWRHGLISRAVLSERERDAIPALLSSSAALGLVELVLLPIDQRELIALVAMLEAHARGLAFLESLQIRSLGYHVLPAPLDIGPLFAALPRLARLRIHASQLPVRIASPLVELSVTADDGAAPTWLDAGATLETLFMRSPEPLRHAPWLTRARFPRLNRLGFVSPAPCDVPMPDFAIARRERGEFRGDGLYWTCDDAAAEAVRAAPAALVGLWGEGIAPGVAIPLTGHHMRIGRSQQWADIAVRSQFVARRNCELRFADGWTVRDLGSANGTRLEDGHLASAPAPLRDGAELAVGRSSFIFVQGDVEARVAAVRRAHGL